METFFSYLLPNELNIQTAEERYNFLTTDAYIPPRFRSKILRFCVFNYVQGSHDYLTPLVMCLQGNRGEGKRYMIEVLCKELNISLLKFDYTPYNDNGNGDNGNYDITIKILKDFKNLYEQTCSEVSCSGKFSLILLQNSLLEKCDSDTVFAFLSDLIDKPYIYDVRVPIILVGEKIDTAYSDFFSRGQMDLFVWQPTLEEKFDIVSNIFSMYKLPVDKAMIVDVVRKYNNQPISFFNLLSKELFLKQYDSALEEFDTFSEDGNLKNISEYVVKHFQPIDNMELKTLSEFAAEIFTKTH